MDKNLKSLFKSYTRPSETQQSMDSGPDWGAIEQSRNRLVRLRPKSNRQSAQPAQSPPPGMTPAAKTGAEQKAMNRWFNRPTFATKSRELIAQLEQTYGTFNWNDRTACYTVSASPSQTEGQSALATLVQKAPSELMELERLFDMSPLQEEPWRSQLIELANAPAVSLLECDSEHRPAAKTGITDALEHALCEEPWLSERANVVEIALLIEEAPNQFMATPLGEEPWLSDLLRHPEVIDEVASSITIARDTVFSFEPEPLIYSTEELSCACSVCVTETVNLAPVTEALQSDDILSLDPAANAEVCTHIFELPPERLMSEDNGAEVPASIALAPKKSKASQPKKASAKSTKKKSGKKKR